jgi:hypothetical protein
MGRECGTNGGKRNSYRLLAGNSEIRKPIRRRRWIDNIKTDLAEIGWGGLDWIGLAQDRDQWRAL